tara:strand:- start:23 stop:148 length:126 start_codon:yes stop_codon:yes gene_type:complete
MWDFNKEYSIIKLNIGYFIFLLWEREKEFSTHESFFIAAVE